jgi:hypothetical protein
MHNSHTHKYLQMAEIHNTSTYLCIYKSTYAAHISGTHTHTHTHTCRNQIDHTGFMSTSTMHINSEELPIHSDTICYTSNINNSH